MRLPFHLLPIICLVVLFASVCGAAPIQRVEGVITEVGEGFLLLQPDGHAETRKFILRWKAHFVPPKLPLKGDRVLILYKNKDEGAVIYELNYRKAVPGYPEPGG